MWMVARFSPFEWELSSPSKIREMYDGDCECENPNNFKTEHHCCEMITTTDQKVITTKRHQTIETICGHHNRCNNNKNFNHFKYSSSTFTLAICNDENCLEKHNAEDYFNNHMYRNSYYMKNFHDNPLLLAGHDNETCDEIENDVEMMSDELNLERSVTITPRSRDILLDEEPCPNVFYEEDDAAMTTDDDSLSSNEIELTTFHNDFSLYNSFWYMIGTLMQGSDLHPKVSFHIFYVKFFVCDMLVHSLQ